MNYRTCLACGQACPEDEIIGGRCDACAATGRQIDEKLVEASSHRRNLERAARRSTVGIGPTEKRKSAAEVFQSMLEAEAEKQDKRGETHRAKCEAIVTLNILLNDLSQSKFKIGGNTWSLPRCWTLIGTYSDDAEPEVQIKLGEVRCVKSELHIDVDLEVGLTGWLDTDELWAANALGINACPAPASNADKQIKLDISICNSLLDLEDEQLVVWNLDPEKFADLGSIPDIPPDTIKFPKSSSAERAANQILAGERDELCLSELEQLGEISALDHRELIARINRIRDDYESFHNSLDLIKAAKLQRDVYQKIRRRLYWDVVETSAYRKEPPRCPKGRHITKLAESADAAFHVICKYLANYLQCNLGRATAARNDSIMDWDALLAGELAEHAGIVGHELDTFREKSIDDKLVDLGKGMKGRHG